MLEIMGMLNYFLPILIPVLTLCFSLLFAVSVALWCASVFVRAFDDDRPYKPYKPSPDDVSAALWILDEKPKRYYEDDDEKPKRPPDLFVGDDGELFFDVDV